jgi:hypothetical protein
MKSKENSNGKESVACSGQAVTQVSREGRRRRVILSILRGKYNSLSHGRRPALWSGRDSEEEEELITSGNWVGRTPPQHTAAPPRQVVIYKTILPLSRLCTLGPLLHHGSHIPSRGVVAAQLHEGLSLPPSILIVAGLWFY